MIPDYIWFAMQIMAMQLIALGVQCINLRRRIKQQVDNGFVIDNAIDKKTARDLRQWTLVAVIIYEFAILFTLTTEYVLADQDTSSWQAVGFMIGFATASSLFVMFRFTDTLNNLSNIKTAKEES